MAQKRGLQPHRIRYWMNPVIEDEAAFSSQLREIVALNEDAVALAQQGTRVVSCDEKTGMQAIERLGRWSMTPRHTERHESWYTRHGTLCLIANMDLATGEAIAPTLGETRGNEDFLAHIVRTVATDPDASWIFVVDNLNTHSSEPLVRWVAERCRVTTDLGKTGRTGILRNQASRRAFLTESGRSVRFVYTPRHCSWLNEVERWFSKLARAVLRRGSFTSKEDLRQRILAFIQYYNVVDASPHKWRITADELLRKLRIDTSDSLN